MASGWRTIRVFISSTFRDMQDERDYLVRFIFPRLRDTLVSRRIDLIDVDLRWGVTSDQNVLEVCRDVIDECRPRFLCLLGGRYGWLPPGRSRSITEDEVRYGVLDRTAGQGYAYFYFRDPSATAAIAAPESGSYCEVPGTERERKLDSLKRAIRDAGFLPFEYPARWDAAARRMVGLEALGDRVYSDILRSVDDEFGPTAAEASDGLALERGAMEVAAQGLLQHFVPGSRTAPLETLTSWCRDSGRGPQLTAVFGPEGIGKSTLLAACSSRLSAELPLSKQPFVVVAHFVGATVGSNSLAQMLDRFCRELDTFAGVEVAPPQELEALLHCFVDSLERAARVGSVVLLVDGIDQLDGDGYARSARWIPRRLPDRVRILVSCSDRAVLENLDGRQAIVVLPLGPFTRDDAAALTAGFLRRYGKQLNDDQLRDFLTKEGIGSPLYVLAALEELRTLGRYEEITDRLHELPDAIDAMFRWILRRLAGDPALHGTGNAVAGEQLVCDLCRLLAASRNGLSSADLAALLCPGDPNGEVAALLRLLRPYMTKRGPLLDFRHELFRRVAADENLPSEDARTATHSRLADHFREQADASRNGAWSGDHPYALRELPFHLVRGRRWNEAYDVMTDFAYIERRISDGASAARDFGTLLIVPNFGDDLDVRCEACGLTFRLNTAHMRMVRRASLACTRCSNALRLAQL